MTQIEELKDLDLVVDDMKDYLNGITISELEDEKRLWEERICNDEIYSPLQKPRLRILKEINREIESRR
nr:MAG TPA: hypothetical protein [Caudoviricetes sp.]